MDDLELEKYVDYVFKTPFGGILRMNNGSAIILRGSDSEILSSLEDYHAKYKGDKDKVTTWEELTNVADKTNFFKANAATLNKIKWIEVEAVVEAARKLKTAETRKGRVEIVVTYVIRVVALFSAIRGARMWDSAYAWYWDMAIGTGIFIGIYIAVVAVAWVICRAIEKVWTYRRYIFKNQMP